MSGLNCSRAYMSDPCGRVRAESFLNSFGHGPRPWFLIQFQLSFPATSRWVPAPSGNVRSKPWHTSLIEFDSAYTKKQPVLIMVSYNYGEDLVNLLLSAVLWERVGEVNESRVDWLRLRDLDVMWKGKQDAVRIFVARQVAWIDEGQGGSEPWRVYGIGRFPGLTWNLQVFGSASGYFPVKANEEFLSACRSDTGVRLSTKSWFEKVAIRHSHGYHPLLNVQAWIRLPIGLTYSLVPLAAGAGVMVGGCMLDAAGKGNGALCQLSVVGGVAMMRTASAVMEGALQPDLRHWEHVPAAFVVTRASKPELESCLPKLGTAVQRLW